MNLRKNAILGLSSAFVFALLYITGVLTSLEDRLYDFFLHFRANRERLSDVVFLDVDDNAIAYYGIFPWPRSIPADGLLRLKEYGARAAIFDIEYIDKGPQGVDSLYLNQGLGNDFFRSFSEIDSAAQNVLSAVKAGRIRSGDIDYYAGSLSALIKSEQTELFNKARNVARDNDLYLAQALALFGDSWTTLNLRSYPLYGEEAQRRFFAQERFAYPVTASSGARLGKNFVDILPALPAFSLSAKGAGFTNAEIDGDGVRRRIYLVQNVYDHWYPQLAFAPLLDYLGRPEVLLEKRKLTLKQARLPDGKVKDIAIPLDHHGRMMLDWPKENYNDSYTHISFAVFSQLDEIEAELELYSRALASSDLPFFASFDGSLAAIPAFLDDIVELFDAASRARNHAMENNSGDSFDAYLEYRSQAFALLGEIAALDAGEKVRGLIPLLSDEHPNSAELIEEEGEYIAILADSVGVDLARHNELTESSGRELRDKFVILGRVDTGSTDFGVNPFHGNYVNVGTHGVVLDMVLSETFIIPVSFWFTIIFMLIFIPLFFVFSERLTPVMRAVCGFSVTAVILIFSVLLFRFTGVFLGQLGTVLALIIAIIIREIISYAGSEKEKQFIRTAFSTYVSGDVVKEIISDPSRLQLGGTKRHMTAIFTDVQSFSTISEQIDPEELVSLLNKYLSAMSDVILCEKGTIDKFEGDAIIAFFGAPLELSDHALRACVSAITIKKIEAELNKTIMEHKLSPSPLLTRIGINTGFMVAGNMGTANKMNYTIMGNAVNLASRLEGVNKQYGTWILASHDTVRETGDRLLYRRLDRVRVVGINEPVRLCELFELAEHADERDKKLVSVFHDALDNFEKRDWKQAADGFKEAMSIKESDNPSKLYLQRCAEFLKQQPDDKWDGVYNLTSK
jgi:adenylate cyclase